MKKLAAILLLSSLIFQFGCVHISSSGEDASSLSKTDVSTLENSVPEKLVVEKIEGIENYQTAADQLKAEMQVTLKKHATPEEIAIMKKSSSDLAIAMPHPGLAVGDKAPDFELPNAFGDLVKLSDELRNGPVVLVFYRGGWCPYCNLHLHAVQSIVPELNAYNAKLIAITPQQPDESAKQLEEKKYPFAVLSDLDYQVMKDYNLYFNMSSDLLPIYQKFGIDLEVYNGKGRTGLPIPGTLVIDQSGIVRAIQADTDYKKRMEPVAILKAVKGICES